MNQQLERPAPINGYNENPHLISIPVYLVLTIITCGIFNIYWNYRQMMACNDLLNREEFNFWLWFLFCVLTCGLYHIYYQYKMGLAIVEIQRNRDTLIFENLPIISIVVTILGLTIIVDCIHQAEINKLVV